MKSIFNPIFVSFTSGINWNWTDASVDYESAWIKGTRADVVLAYNEKIYERNIRLIIWFGVLMRTIGI